MVGEWGLFGLASVLGPLENFNVALNDAQAGSRLAIGILVAFNAGLAFNVNHGALGQAQQEVFSVTLSEACDAEPARLAVVLGASVASDGVSENFAAGAGGLDLGGISEVAYNGDASERSRGRSAERAGSASRGGGCAAEQEGRHCCR